MTTDLLLEAFAQPLPSTSRLSPMARAISARIGNGRPAPWAGFVWYRPRPARDETLDRAIAEHLRATRRAA